MSLPAGRRAFLCGAAVVLAGGAGRRMGGDDKAALDVGGTTMLDRVLSAARPACRRLVVVGPRRPTSVPAVIFTLEPHPGGGPVPAVEAGIAASGAEDHEAVLVLAVDLPLLTTADLDRLLDALEDPRVDAAPAAGPAGRPNPLLAAYRVSRIPRLGPSGRGMPAARLLPESVMVVDLGHIATFNVNSRSDLGRARELLGLQE